MSKSPTSTTTDAAIDVAGRLLANIGFVIRGKHKQIKLVLAALACKGHVQIGVASSIFALTLTAGVVTARGSDEVLRPKTVIQGSFAQPGGSITAYAAVGNRIIDITGFLYSASNRDQAKADAIDYHKSFSVLAEIFRPTTGYSVTIRRVKILRASRQACVVVAIQAPGARAVERKQTTFFHLVELPRRSFGPVVADRIVVRDTAGRLIYAGRYPKPANPALCR